MTGLYITCIYFTLTVPYLNILQCIEIIIMYEQHYSALNEIITESMPDIYSLGIDTFFHKESKSNFLRL